MWVGKARKGVPGGKRSACGGLDDEVLLALAADDRVGEVGEVNAGAGRVGGDGLVAEVEAEPAGPGPADRRGSAGPRRG